MTEKWMGILNGQAGKGNAGQVWTRIEPLFPQKEFPLQVQVTTSRSQIEEQVRKVRKEGQTRFLCLGGDGTFSAILDGLFADGELKFRPVIGGIGLGKENNLYKPITSFGEIGGMCSRLDVSRQALHDVIRLEGNDADGKPFLRHGLQSAHVGITSAINRAQRSPGCFLGVLGRLWEKLAQVLISFRQLSQYPGFSGSVFVNGESFTGFFRGLSIVKRPFVSGNFIIKTGRKSDDGQCDLGLINKIEPMRLMGLLGQFEQQGLSGHSEVQFREGKEGSLTLENPDWLCVDGDLLMIRDVRWSVLPSAVELLG